MTEGMRFRLVAPGEAAVVVAAYGRAVVLAGRVRELLCVTVLDPHTMLVAPSLTRAGEPMVYLTP